MRAGFVYESALLQYRTMNTAVKKKRRGRVQKMNRILKKLYPEAKIALNFNNEWECLIAVVLSAQCTDKRVNQVTEKLFKKYRSLDAYAQVSQKAFERDVFQCGFYRNKAKHIRGAAKMVKDHFGGVLPTSMDEMLLIPGVARKTANVLLSTLFGVHEGIAVDTHVRRFAIRFDLSDFKDPARIERDLMELMPQKDWWGFNHRLVQYGRDYCGARKHPCADHPLTGVYPKAAMSWPRAK